MIRNLENLAKSELSDRNSTAALPFSDKAAQPVMPRRELTIFKEQSEFIEKELARRAAAKPSLEKEPIATLSPAKPQSSKVDIMAALNKLDPVDSTFRGVQPTISPALPQSQKVEPALTKVVEEKSLPNTSNKGLVDTYNYSEKPKSAFPESSPWKKDSTFPEVSDELRSIVIKVRNSEVKVPDSPYSATESSETNIDRTWIDDQLTLIHNRENSQISSRLPEVSSGDVSSAKLDFTVGGDKYVFPQNQPIVSLNNPLSFDVSVNDSVAISL